MENQAIPSWFGRQVRRFLPVETVCFLAVWLMLMAAGRDRLFQDPGTFWHLAWGKQMLQTGHVPRTDTFSFTRWGQPVVDDQWLAEFLMVGVHRLADWEGLLLLTAAALAGLYGWIGGRLVRAGIAPLWAVLILALVFLASAHNFHVRPLIASLILQAAWFAGLLAVDAGRTPIWRLWLFVPLSTLWANLHGGVLAGLGTLGLCSVFWMVQWGFRRRGPIQSHAQALLLVAILGGCLLAVLVNPYGLDLLRNWYATLSMDLGRWIQEHRPWTVSEPAGWAALVLLVGYLAVLAPMVRQGQFQAAWAMPIVWFLLGMQRVRNLPLFAVVTALGIAELVRCRLGERPLEGRKDPVEEDGGPCPSFSAERGLSKYVIPALLVGTTLALQTAGCPAPLVGSPWVRFSAERWPVGLAEELQTASARCPEGTPIFNDLDFGGWIIYFTPRWRVFIDDRCALYGEEFLSAYDQARRQNPAQLARWQEEYGFRWALVRRGSGWDRYLASLPLWECLGRDEAAAWYHLRDR